MNTYEAICSRRSIREFEDRPVPYELLEKFVNAGRLAPQAANRQPLEFVIVDNADLVEVFFRNTRLGKALGWEPGPNKGARAYIVILANTRIQKSAWIPFDVGLAAGNIALAAWDDGVASCLIGAFNKENITELLHVPAHYQVPLLIALGYPAHKSFAEEMEGDDVNYWRDGEGNFHVPKRPLEKIIHHNEFCSG